jgi:cytochrome c-type biogenesis protein CcmH
MGANVLAEAVEQYKFDKPEQRTQFYRLLRELRCLVCQNQDLADSNASLAMDLKDIVYQKVLRNQTDSEITDFLTDRYGDFVLFNPPVKTATYLLWFGPFLLLVIGLIILFRFVYKVKANDTTVG